MTGWAQTSRVGRVGEDTVASWLKGRGYHIVAMSDGNFSPADIYAVKCDTAVDDIPQNMTSFEVKTDTNCTSGNIFIEIGEKPINQDLKGHGLYSTSAQYVAVYKPCSQKLYLAKVEALNRVIKKQVTEGWAWEAKGGEEGRTLGINFAEADWDDHAKKKTPGFWVISGLPPAEPLDRSNIQPIHANEARFSARPPRIRKEDLPPFKSLPRQAMLDHLARLEEERQRYEAHWGITQE